MIIITQMDSQQIIFEFCGYLVNFRPWLELLDGNPHKLVLYRLIFHCQSNEKVDTYIKEKSKYLLVDRDEIFWDNEITIHVFRTTNISFLEMNEKKKELEKAKKDIRSQYEHVGCRTMYDQFGHKIYCDVNNYLDRSNSRDSDSNMFHFQRIHNYDDQHPKHDDQIFYSKGYLRLELSIPEIDYNFFKFSRLLELSDLYGLSSND